MSQGGQRQSGGIVQPGNTPYEGVNRVLLSNATGPDKVFGSSMPTGQPNTTAPGANAGTIYGNQNYVNPNLQGYMQGGQNIINTDQLNNGVIAPMDANAIEQLRRNSLTGGPINQSPNMPGGQPYQQYQQYQPNAPASNLPPAPTGDPNQMYMQPPVLPQINEMQPTPSQPMVNTGAPNVQPYHDLSTAEGSLDYLNSIAPSEAPTKKAIPSKLFVAVGIGAIILVVLVAIIGALGSSQPSLGARAQALGKTLANLQSIIEYGKDNSQYINSDLDGVTAETHLVMLSHQTQLGQLMTLAVDEKGEATDLEADETTTEDLDTALAQGHLSEIYQDAMQERLTAVMDATEAAYNATDNTEIKNALNSTYIDIENLLNRVNNAVATGGGEAAD